MNHNGYVCDSYLVLTMTRELILLAAGNHSASIKVTKLLYLKDIVRKETLTSCPTVPYFRILFATMSKYPAHLCLDRVLLYSDPQPVTAGAWLSHMGI